MKPSLAPKKYLEYLGLGAEIAATLLMPMLMGYMIDQRLNTSPLVFLIGVVVGITLFILLVFRIAKNLDKNTNA